MCFSRVPIRSKSSIYIIIIANSSFDFLIKMYGYIGYSHTLLLIGIHEDDCTHMVKLLLSIQKSL